MKNARPTTTRRFVTSEDIRQAAGQGNKLLSLPQPCTVTDEARELAYALGVGFDDPSAAKQQAPAPAAPVPTAAPSGERRIDAAIAAVLGELPASSRSTALVAEVTRRVLATLKPSIPSSR